MVKQTCDLVNKVDKLTGDQFEVYITKLLKKLPQYDKVIHTQFAGDYGVDVTACKHNVDYGFQCKHTSNPSSVSNRVGYKAVEQTISGCEVHHIGRGVVVTNGYFTNEAKNGAKKVGIDLWNRNDLIHILKYGNLTADTYEVNKQDANNGIQELNKQRLDKSYISYNPDNLVIKSNYLIQNSHYSMPLEDQKILDDLICSITSQQHSLTVRFNIKHFANMLGITKKQSNLNYIKASISSIINDNFWIKKFNGTYKLWRWIDDAYSESNGDFVIKFNPELRKYLFNHNIHHKTIYDFSDIMLMRSRYSPRLYEIFKSNQPKQKIHKFGVNYSVVKLRYSLDLMQHYSHTNKIKRNKYGYIEFMYPRFTDFRRKVLTPSIKEINELTGYNVKIKELRHSRRVVGINVVMTRKNKKQRAKRNNLIYCITHHILSNKKLLKQMTAQR